MRQQPKNTERY